MMIRPKLSESNDEEKEIGSFNYAVSITRNEMRLLGFWPQDTRFLCDLQYGVIFVLIVFFAFVSVIQMCILVHTATDWNSVMVEAVNIIPIIPFLVTFIFMKVMAKNFRFVLHTMTVDWANYRYLVKRSRRIMISHAKRGRWFNIFKIVLLMLSITGYVLTPVVNMWSSDSLWNVTARILPHGEGFYPFYNKESPARSPVYEILYVAQSLVMFLGGATFATMDCFLYIIVFHVCGQFDILAATLEQYNGTIRHHHCPKDIRNCACLSCIVKQHVHILKCASIIEKSFRDIILLQLLTYWILVVLEGRELILHIQHSNIQGIIMSILYVLSIMYCIFISCYISECVIEKSEDIGRVAQDLQWQLPRDSNLPIIIARAKIPCKLTAGRFFTLSFPCYTTILTTTISYISVLAALK